jgi:uncharacterized membrane protein
VIGVDKVSILAGVLIGGLMCYLLAAGHPAAALLTLVFGVAALEAAWRLRLSRARKTGEVLYDEMHIALASRSSLAALRMSILTIGAALVALIWPRILGLELVPESVVDRLYPGLGLGLTIVVAACWASYAYYSKTGRMVEG